MRNAVVGGWSGWSLVSVDGDYGLAKRQRQLGKKKEGLSSFGQKTRGMTERGVREVVARVFHPMLFDEMPFRTRMKK